MAAGRGPVQQLFRENSGYWQVDEARDGTLVTYAIAVRTTLPPFATSGTERQSVIDTITSLRKVVATETGTPAR